MGMTTPAIVAMTDASLTVRVPMRHARRGGRKVMIAPTGTVVQGSAMTLPRPRVVSSLVKAIARAFRWRDLLESGVYATVSEIAKVEKINDSYVSRVLRLTLLAPDIVEAILDGRQSPDLQLVALLKTVSDKWAAQRQALPV